MLFPPNIHWHWGAMSKCAMPFLYVNLGCEMLYVIQQRLQAQKVAERKATMVLRDVLRIMFCRETFNCVAEPQETYSEVSMRGVYSRIAHSSIMKLSETRYGSAENCVRATSVRVASFAAVLANCRTNS